ncbi:MAG: TPM domain-containing protein [Acidobacteriia bacterium]|nr:TPM domain-containing protein [Terriglobia bacterium]
MRGHHWILALLCACLLWVPASRAQSVDQVAPQVKAAGYVTDLAGVLSQPAREQLTALCTEVDQKTQAQIAVVTIKSLEGRTVDDYTVDLAERLGIGPKSSNRGVLILVAPNDHKYWTSVGYGLESILPDGKVGGYGREAVPYFRNNDYDAAVFLMTRRVADVIAADRGITLSGSSPEVPATDRDHSGINATTIIIIAIVLMILAVQTRYAKTHSGRRFVGGRWIGPMGGGWGGGFGGGGGGGGGFGGFGGGGFGGGGAGGGW